MQNDTATKIRAIRKVLAHMLNPDMRVTTVLSPDEIKAMRAEFGDLLERHEASHGPMTPRVPAEAKTAGEVVDRRPRGKGR